jgi:hypothetical protein
MMYVYLVGDPSKENKMDFSGFMLHGRLHKIFRHKDQTNKPVRSALK